MNNDKYKKLYLQEAATHIEGIERRILALEKDPSQHDIVDGLFRHFHSIKGMSASMGYEPIKELAHSQESILAGIRDKKTSATDDIITGLLNSLDSLRELIGSVEKNEPLERRKDEAVPAAQSPKTRRAVTNKAKAARPPLRLPGMVKVESALFDDMLRTAGELFMILGTFKTVAKDLRSIDLKDSVHNLEKTINRLHGSIYSARMLPIADLTGGLPRIVRDMAAKSDKRIKLSIKGGEISLDRAILDDLASPLVHIIRNAVDHGIESTAERTALGKPAEGSINVHAWQKKQRVVIKITDDGRGIDTEAVRAKLVASGMNANDGAAMSREELLMATCRAGLSTSTTLTDTSGRGVGMDAVKDAVEAHGGTLYIDSIAGKGTSVTIELQRRSSIIRTLMVRAGGKEMLAPISLIKKIVEIERVTEPVTTLEFEDKEIPVVNLASEMSLTSKDRGRAVLIIEKLNMNAAKTTEGIAQHSGILVDDFGIEMEAYVKSLTPPLMKIWGISGVTVMGDGRPVFILDIPQIIERAVPVNNTLP